MSNAEEVKFSLKVMINKERTKVLFAESNSHFVDVLLSFLTLPLGRIVKVMVKHYGDGAPIIGCLNTLYNSVSNLDSPHFWTEGAKQILLDPTSSVDIPCLRLKLYVHDAGTEWFCCKKCPGNKFWIHSIYYDKSICKTCGGAMERVKSKRPYLAERGDGVFVLNTATFLISDDLRIVPNAIGLLQTISTLDITGTENAELMNVTLGRSDVIDLLRVSMISQTPLSDLFLKSTRKLKVEMSLTQIPLVENPNSKKMILKVTVQKSSNRFLYAQANEDFVEFLFSLLTIPLGGVECLLVSKTSIRSIDNLYRSVSGLIDDKYFKNSGVKKRLIEPKLPHGYISKNQILPLNQESLPDSYQNISLFSSVCFPQGQGSYVKGSAARTYLVLDNLTVIPFSISSIICSLNQQKIPVSDVKELEMEIGLEEAMSILKASLTSDSALSDALLNRMSSNEANKKPESSNLTSNYALCDALLNHMSSNQANKKSKSSNLTSNSAIFVALNRSRCN